MQIKTYEAKNMQEALAKIKNDLGPEAVILKAKQKKGLLGLGEVSGVEVTAAVTKNSLLKKKYAESKMPKATIEKLKNSKASVQKEVYDRFAKKIELKAEPKEEIKFNQSIRKPLRNTKYIDIDDDSEILEDGTVLNKNIAIKAYTKKQEAIKEFIKEEIKPEKIIKDEELNQEIASNDRQAQNFETYNLLNEIKQKLLFENVDPYYVEQTIATVNEVCHSINIDKNNSEYIKQVLSRIISKQIKVETNFLNTSLHEPKLFAFLGEKSAGKTTSIIKIASYYKDKNINLAIISYGNLDEREKHQIDSYSKLSNIKIYQVQMLSDLINILRELRDIDLVLIDLEKTSFFSLEYPVSTHLVMDASSSYENLKNDYEKFKVFNPSSIIYTKFDLIRTYGNIFNMSVYSKLPISFLSLGKKVPEDLLIPSSEEIAEMVLLKIIE